MISIAAVRAMLDAMERYVPSPKREEARGAALAAGIGYSEPESGKQTKTFRHPVTDQAVEVDTRTGRIVSAKVV